MPLIHDRPDINPGLHALIIGVSQYTHLPALDDPSTARSFGLRSLTTAASSAFALFKWLTQRARPPVLWQASVCDPPSDEEIKKQPELRQYASSCSVSDLIVEASEWRINARANAKGMTLFYFAGQGMGRSKDDTLLLFSDFSTPTALRCALP